MNISGTEIKSGVPFGTFCNFFLCSLRFRPDWVHFSNFQNLPDAVMGCESLDRLFCLDVAHLVPLPLPRTTTCIVEPGRGVPQGALPNPVTIRERTTTMDIRAGLDAALPGTSVCALGTDGSIMAETTAPTDPGSPVDCIRGLPGSVRGY